MLRFQDNGANVLQEMVYHFIDGTVASPLGEKWTTVEKSLLKDYTYFKSQILFFSSGTLGCLTPQMQNLYYSL